VRHPVSTAMLAVGLTILLAVSGLGTDLQHEGPTGLLVAGTSGTATFSLSDNGTISTVVGSITHTLSDQIIDTVNPRPAVRSFVLSLNASAPLATVYVSLTTNPLYGWSDSSQLPGGADYLPPMHDWRWSVVAGRVSDTRNWSLLSNGLLSRTVAWKTQAFTITGVPQVESGITVNPGKSDGTHAPGLGFQMGNLPTNDPDYTTMAGAVHPSVVRIVQLYQAPSVWDNSTHKPIFDFAPMWPLVNFTAANGSGLFISFPAGSWGDGNTLPSGMPLNRSLPIDWTQANSIGYFPTTTAYATYLTTFAQAVKANGWNISYWNLGNEVPVANTSEASAFAVVFNAGARAIHGVFPSALVGSDVLLVKSKLGLFAQSMKGVGFIAFHAYPAEGLCTPVTVYCVPDNVNNYNRNAQVLAKTTNYSGFAVFEAPRSAQWAWYNATGKWLPIIDAETNLNSAQGDGTDPRQQTLFGAAWLAYSLIQAARENVSAEIVHCYESINPLPASATSAYGGWGFGLTAEGNNDANLKFAPYYVAELWGNHFPAGAAGLQISDNQSKFVIAYAVQNATALSVLVDNLVGTSTSVTLSVSGGKWNASQLYRLDFSTYRERYNVSRGTELLTKSSMAVYSGTGWTSTVRFGINGYGVDVIVFAKKSIVAGPQNPGTSRRVLGAFGTSVHLQGAEPTPSAGLCTLGVGIASTTGLAPVVGPARIARAPYRRDPP
jgi:hypothetical protein